MEGLDKKRVGVLALVALVLIAAVYLMWPAKARADSLPNRGAVASGEVAAPVSNWTGLYVGIDGGYSVLDAKASRSLGIGDKNDVTPADAPDGAPAVYSTEFRDPLSVMNADLGGSAGVYGARVGFDWHVGSSPFVLGLLGGYGWGQVDGSADFAQELGADTLENVHAASFSIEPTWYVGVRAGYVLGGRSLLYVGAAFTQAEADGSIVTRTGDRFRGSDTLNGYTLMAGLETAIAPQWTLGAEYGYSRFDDFSFTSVSEIPADGAVRYRQLDVEPDVHAFKVRLNWRPMSK